MKLDSDQKGVLAFVILLSLAILLLLVVKSHARDAEGRYDNSPYKEWFRAQHNSAGGWCCDEGDGHAYEDDYVFDADGNVHISIDGKPLSVESWKVLKGPNPTGHAIVWYLMSVAGAQVYCFAPGQMG